MKIDKAIEIKEAYFRGDEPDDPLDLIKADRLSLEALKRRQLDREAGVSNFYELLPGETNE